MNTSARFWSVRVLIGALLIFGWVSLSFAQDEKVDINALVQEIQKMSDETDEMTLVWWIPEEFWLVSFAQDPSVTETQTQEFLSVLRPYTIIAVVDGTLGPFGGVTYRPEAEIRSTIRIKDNQGTRYQPLGEDEVGADTKSLLAMMKPVFVNMFGPMGENMHFVIFPAKDKEGRRIGEAKREGAFSVSLGEREFRWRLPLGSLLPPKICPTCGEKLSGAYGFCPWDGAELK
ncbi:MAG: hypothetical protein JSW58_17430 [Candidatus Latescibacterota bacterium]|nr:MAG: hypothetical protein JSW58_17430 [Candidatus Latescibacterota bacterium]